MPFLKIPSSITTSVEAHRKWIKIVENAQELVEADIDLQEKAAKFLRLKERSLPPEVLGRNYAQYCSLINKMYDAYLNSVHLQRSKYMLEIISVFMARLYELRNELVYLLVTDYIYVDAALSQLHMTPNDIQIIVPYHIPLECRPDSMEQLLQKMWMEAEKRKKEPPIVVKPAEVKLGSEEDLGLEPVQEEPSVEESSIEESVHTIIPEEFIQMCVIQKQERYRQYFVKAFMAQSRRRRMYFSQKVVEPPLHMKTKAASLIQRIYRTIMKIKRQKAQDLKRDIMLGIIPDPFKRRLDFEEENTKMYERRRRTKHKIEQAYKREMERENVRLLVYKKDDQIEDITVQVQEWFKEWFYGSGFFPEFPYPIEGGTLMVMTGAYPTIEEKMEANEKLLAATKGKTKEQLKQEKEQAKADAILKAEALREAKKKEAEQLFKSRCNPFSDPGYQVQKSTVTDGVIDALRKYRTAWSIYDRFPADTCAELIYGYTQEILTEDLMHQLHKDCRVYVDELMRLDLKLLIKMHQLMYKRVGWKFPRQPTRRAPKSPPLPKLITVDNNLLKSFEDIFNLGIITKPTSKLKDIFGDLNYAAYEMNITDPNAKFPPPGYGDVRRRLLLSCIFGSAIVPGAKRNKAVLLVGPPRNGKSFMVDCVAGEINGVKIDISPEVLCDAGANPAKLLARIFTAAKVFQPSVIYCRDIERVFAKKVQPQDKRLKAATMKKPLLKLLKLLSVDDYKVIFIATCSYPQSAKASAMVALFNEVLLVPRADYGSLQRFFQEKFQSISGMPRDYCVQALAQMLQGYGTGFILEIYQRIMTDERIIRLHVTPLSPSEFIEPLIEQGLEPVSIEDYQLYMDFCIENSPLKAERQEYEVINSVREKMYIKMGKKQEEG